MNTTTRADARKFIPMTEVLSRYSVSRSTIVTWVAKGTFPKPAKIGGALRWDTATLDAFDARLTKHVSDPLS